MDKDNELMKELLAEIKECRADVKRVKTVVGYVSFLLLAAIVLTDFFNGLRP